MNNHYVQAADRTKCLAALKAAQRVSLHLRDCQFLADAHVEEINGVVVVDLANFVHNPHPGITEEPPILPEEITIIIKDEAQCHRASDIMSVSGNDVSHGFWSLIFPGVEEAV